ncbi:MAG: hypothetical protein FWD36_01405 [Treponema sp.]|nr:hypothetical protein [Treponema sp.]
MTHLHRIGCIILVAVFSICFAACPGSTSGLSSTPSGEGTAEATVVFIEILEGAPVISEDIVLDRNVPDKFEWSITLQNIAQYDAGSIVWKITGTSMEVNGPVLLLDAWDPLFKNSGIYFATVSVRKGGVPYGVTFPVEFVAVN